MPPIEPLTQSESMTLAKDMLASLNHLKVSEAKVMFTVLAWFISGLYHLGFEIVQARGEEVPAPTGAGFMPAAYTGPTAHREGDEAGLP